MAFQVVESQETEDYYQVTLSFRPQGEFAGTTGQEQFFIAKEGNVAHRQVLSLPRPNRRFPSVPVALVLAALVVTAGVGVVVAVGSGGGDERQSGLAAPLGPTSTAAPFTPTPAASPATESASTSAPVAQATPSPQSIPADSNPPFPSVLDPPVATQEMAFVPINHQGGLDIRGGQAIAQVFTSPSDGKITGAEFLGVSRNGCEPGEELKFQLLATNEGGPSDLVFYSQTVPFQAIPEQPSNVSIDFGPNGWSVGQFESLALELSSNALSTSCTYTWDGDSSGSYTGGQAFTKSSGGGEWRPDSRDMGFRMFFEPEGVAAALEPASTPLPQATRALTPTPPPTSVLIVVTAVPPPTPTIRPRTIPTSTPRSVPSGSVGANLGYFTVGSTKDEVLAAQGSPDSFTDTRWEFGCCSWVRFVNDRVTTWNDTGLDDLNARLEPSGPVGANLGYFTVGSTKDEVLAAQGSPDSFTDTRWEFGCCSWVRFVNDRVTTWNDTGLDDLNAKLEP